MTDLKLCPFCKHEPETMQSLVHSGIWYVYCKHCEEHGALIQGRMCNSKDEAILWWNSHANTPYQCKFNFDQEGRAGAYETYVKCSHCGVVVNMKSVHNYCAYCGSLVVNNV